MTGEGERCHYVDSDLSKGSFPVNVTVSMPLCNVLCTGIKLITVETAQAYEKWVKVTVL